MRNKFLSILLSAAIIISLSATMPLNALATSGNWTDYATAFANGDGSSGDPFQIATEEQLAYLASSTIADQNYANGKFFVLTADINLAAHEWVPITMFRGSLDGQGHRITALTIDAMAAYQGLIAQVGAGAVLKNITLEDCDITGGKFVGPLFGSYEAPGTLTVENCHSSGTVTATDFVGGLFGDIQGTSGGASRTITNCSSSCTVVSTITGDHQCSFAGGLIGRCQGSSTTAADGNTVIGCFASGSVTGQYNIGGLVGWSANSSFTNCYATGAVTDNAGYNTGGLIGCANINLAIINSYASGNVTNENIGSYPERMGGVIGGVDSVGTVAVDNSYYNNANSAGQGGGMALSTEDMQNSDFVDTLNASQSPLPWTTASGSINGGFPVLRWQTSIPAAPVLTAGAVYRTSATAATVRFVSDTAGTYYYQVTNSSTTPAADDLSGWASGDAVSADTITAVSPAGLTAGAKYVHIVAEDAADNLSDVLTVAMPYDLYYFDDFEAYAANAYPANYFQKYNGAGDAEQKVISVVQADAATGNVFRLKGQGSWASNQRVMLPAGITGTVTLEYDVKLVTHGGGVAFGQNDVTWSGGIARVDTPPAGMFSAGISDGTVVHTSTTTCEVGTWYHVALELDYANRTFNYYVDGTKLNDGALNAYTGYTLDYFGLGSSNAGGDEIYYDNVEVYGGALIVADATAPILQSAATNTDGTKVILTFDKAMAAPMGESAEFAVIVNDNLDPVTATTLDPSDAKNIILTLSTPIVYDDDVTVSYPPGGSIESSDGGVLATFTDREVANMVADTTAPVLTAGAVSRTSDTSAAVKFTSNEAGEYYYEVVASGDSAPAIDTEDDGIPCDTDEQTISLTGLTAGAKDIYIVVKDAADNVSSDSFKISIPAYVPAAHGSIQFQSGSWSVPEDYSSHGYVERVGGSDGIVTVDYYTVDDTAIAGMHYVQVSGTLTWADGDSAPKTIPCTIYNDSTYNGYLQFSYALSNPTGGAVLGSQDTLLMQIRDNDNPPIPSGLTATAGNGKVTLNWNEVKDAYYRVYFSTTSASYNEADSVDVYDETSTVITGLKNGTKYYFVVKAVHDIYLSPGSNEVSATPTSGNGGGSSISPDTGSQITISTTDDSTSVTGTLTRVNGGTQIDIKNRAFDKLDAADKPVSINARIATVTFDKKAMDAIGTESGDEDVTVTARQVPASELSRRDRALVGSRPVYDFTVTGGGSTISSFGGGYATVNIPYTLLPGENPHAVVIWYLSDSGTLESVRGCYDAATKTVTFVTPHFSRFVIGYNLVAFSDITSSAWYYDAVTFLAARGVTTGTTAATFSPDDTLTRGQFIVMLLRAYGIESDSTAAHNFSDSGNTYYTGYLAAAKRLGITNGVGNNRFAPEQSITRQEMFTLLYNALRVIGAPPASTAGRTLTDFSDASAIAPWAKDAMTLLVESGTISGSGGKLNPTGITTRGEMAQVLYNLLSK